MKRSRSIILMAVLAAACTAAAADQIYSSTQAEPELQARLLQECVYAGRIFSHGAMLQAGAGIALQCVSAPVVASNEQDDRVAQPVWASVQLDSKAAQKPRK